MVTRNRKCSFQAVTLESYFKVDCRKNFHVLLAGQRCHFSAKQTNVLTSRKRAITRLTGRCVILDFLRSRVTWAMAWQNVKLHCLILMYMWICSQGQQNSFLCILCL